MKPSSDRLARQASVQGHLTGDLSSRLETELTAINDRIDRIGLFISTGDQAEAGKRRKAAEQSRSKSSLRSSIDRLQAHVAKVKALDKSAVVKSVTTNKISINNIVVNGGRLSRRRPSPYSVASLRPPPKLKPASRPAGMPTDAEIAQM